MAVDEGLGADGLEIEPQGPGRFHAVQIKHFGLVQHREVAGFPEVRHQPSENGVPQTPCA